MVYIVVSTNKWSHIKKQTFEGYQYQSGFEAGYAAELSMRLKAKEIIKWERQVKIPLIVNGFEVGNYYIDFVVYYPDGTIEYVETKGQASDVWRLKWKILEAMYSEKPNVRLMVVKQKNNFQLRKIKKVK